MKHAGLHIDRKQLVGDCTFLASRIGDMLACDGDLEQNVSNGEFVPEEFFLDLEEPWRGRIKRIHAEDEYSEVESAAMELSDAVSADFLPIVNCIKGYQRPLGGGLGSRKGEICYNQMSEAVWFKGKNFRPPTWGNTPGEAEMKRLVTAYDGKGKKVGEEWWTTSRVETALSKYKEAVEKANDTVLQLLRDLAAELKEKMNALIFISVLSVIAKTLCLHVSEGRRRNWIFPTLSSSDSDEEEAQAHSR